MASRESSSQLQQNSSACRLLPCANNCGFFGSSETNNLCSFCYRRNAAAQARVFSENQTAASAAVLLPSSSPTTQSEIRHSDGSPPAPQIRCQSCRKRVGVVVFHCRCGGAFCLQHRYSDKHECSFDYKTSARQTIAKDNPVVKASKLRDRI